MGPEDRGISLRPAGERDITERRWGVLLRAQTMFWGRRQRGPSPETKTRRVSKKDRRPETEDQDTAAKYILFL